MNDNNPLVSIIIPVYNGSNYLKEAIDSALSQTYANKEIIVVNDGSNDEGKTEALALSYGDAIRYYYKENGGVSSALNMGIKNMKGEYFSWLSHDDMYLPDKIKIQMNAIKSIEKKKTICLCDFKEINSKSEDIYSISSNKNSDTYFTWDKAMRLLLDRGFFNGCALLIPREALLTTGCFDESLRYCQDLKKWIEILLTGYGVICISNVLVCNRVHEAQLTQTGRSLFYKECEMMTDSLLDELYNKSSGHNNFVKLYALYMAKYDSRIALNKIIRSMNGYGLIHKRDVLELRAVELYGMIRPIIRKLYFKFVRKIKTT